MKFTVLGNNGPFPAAGGACSGYLVSDEDTNILIDCGNGVLSNLQKLISLDRLDAVILTHLHSDHVSDMNVLKYAIQIKRMRGTFDRLLKVYAPNEPQEEFSRLDVKDAFVLEPISKDTVLHIGALKITFAQMKHPFMDFAVSVERRGKKLVYSGDTSWTDEIIRFGKGADLLVLDAGILEKDYTENAAHLTGVQCGIAAAKAGVKKLLLTHFYPEYDVNNLLIEARRNFDNVCAAEVMKEYTI